MTHLDPRIADAEDFELYIQVKKSVRTCKCGNEILHHGTANWCGVNCPEFKKYAAQLRSSETSPFTDERNELSRGQYDN